MPTPVDPDAPGWRLVYDQPALSLNAERKAHWATRHRHTAEVRQAFAILARQAKIGRHDRIAVTVHHEVRRAGPLPDIGNCYPTAKAAVDGLVDAGVITDDIGEHLVHLAFTPPTRSTRDAVLVDVVPA